MKFEFKKAWQSIKENPRSFVALGFSIFSLGVSFSSVLLSFSPVRQFLGLATKSHIEKDSIAVQIERGDRAYFSGRYPEALEFYESAVDDIDFLRSERPGENDVDLIIQPLRSRLNLTQAAIGLAKINPGITRRR